MNRVKITMFSSILAVTVLALLLLRTGWAGAAPAASSCGKWTVVTSPNVGSSSVLNGVAAVSTNDVWAVGYSILSPQNYQPLIEQWNGTSWKVIASPKLAGGGVLNGVTVVSANDIWTVGRSFGSQNGDGLIEHWNGTRWHIINLPIVSAGSLLNGIAVVSANDIWAVGSYFDTSNGSNFLTLVQHWDGKKWSVVPSPTTLQDSDYLSSVAVVSANDVWAVGWSEGNTTIIEHWNGKNWKFVHNPNLGSQAPLNGVAAVSTSDVWAVGSNNANLMHGKTLTEQWNGTSWNVVQSPNTGSSNYLAGVTVVSAKNIWAVGNYAANNGNTQLTLIEHWNGSAWSVVSSPNVGTGNNFLSSVTAVPNTQHVWSVGTANGHTLTEFYC